MSRCSSAEETGNGEFDDWEMLTTSPKFPKPSDTVIQSCPRSPKQEEGPSCSLGILGEDSEGLIDPNYFAHPSSASRINPNFGDPAAVESTPPFFPRVVEDCASRVRFPSDDSYPSSWIDPSDTNNILEEDQGIKPHRSGVQVLADQEAEPEACADGCKSSRFWSKIPLDFLSIKARGFGGLWSFAMAAAVMGFLFLGRRWYRVKCQNKTLRFQVNADDKRISQLMFQAVRLNEAFSAVRRVPVVRAQVSFGGYHDGL